MRLKEFYNFKRLAIPGLNTVAKGEEMSVKIRIYCTRDQIPQITNKLTELTKD
jgi:hypothetical protein